MADPNAGLHTCPICEAQVYYENLPHCTTKETKQAETPASSSPRPKKKVQGATSRKG